MGIYHTKSMSVQYEIKSQLAKLLATEDLIVENRQVETAQFDVDTRVLTLPLWEKASNDVYDMLVGHEVGHALFTQNKDTPTHIPRSFLNVCEDARVEKLMKRKYPGISKSFYKGYKQLSEEDFFSLSGEDVNKMHIADRANLFFKIGNFINISFSPSETKVLHKIEECETFDDVIEAAELLYNLWKNDSKKEDEPDEVKEDEDGVEDYEDEGLDYDDQTIGEIEEEEDKEEPQVHTAQNFEENLSELINIRDIDNVYVELPELNLETVIVSNSEIHKEIDDSFRFQEKSNSTIPSLFLEVDGAYQSFKKSAQREVSYLVKEFECKKSADAYVRATTSNTGVLDCTKLHTYKYNEDLFKKVVTLADGKNHGLVFILDWSGSMATVLEDTIKQLYNLIWFCKKCSIPFDVYAFTNDWHRPFIDYETGDYVPYDAPHHYKKKEGLLVVQETFSLLNILSSKVSGGELERQMINIYRIGSYYSSSYSCPYRISNRFTLSSTPLNEALISLHQILPKFQSQNKLQKVQCIVLTDGEATNIPYYVKIERPNNTYIGCRTLRARGFYVRDRKIGKTYQVKEHWHEFTDLLLQNLRDNFKDINFIGIRVLSSRDVGTFMRLYNNAGTDEYNSLQKYWKKNKSFVIKNSGYHSYFGLSDNSLSQDSVFDVDEGATKAKIKSAFVKSLKAKKLNKKILGEFISLVV